MDLRSICIANCTGIFLLLMLLYTCRTKMLRHRMDDRIFMFLVFGVMIACLMEMLSYLIDGKLFPGARALNYIANTYLYSVNLLLPFCVLVYVDLGLYGDVSRIRKKYKPQIIIGLVMFCVTITNFFVPICYYITERNVYERRPVSYVYYFVILYYCITSIVLTHRYEKENGAKAFFHVYMFLLPILAGAALQFMFYGLSLAWLSAAIGLVGLFMMQQNEMAYIDSLTDTYNRQYLNHIMTAWKNRGICFSGAMLDIDNFKAINDTFGHTEGDRALRTVADLLKQSCLDNEWVFRFAGDEFIILKMSGDADGLQACLDRVQDRLQDRLQDRNGAAAPYRISLSYGVSVYKTGSVDAFMKEMDDQMYAMKAKHHENIT